MTTDSPCTSLSILHRRQASSFVHRQHYGFWTLTRSRPQLAGNLCWAKPLAVTSRSRLVLVVVPTALATACWSIVATLLAILPSLTSWFPLLRPLLVQEPAPYRLMIILPDGQTCPLLHLVLVFHCPLDCRQQVASMKCPVRPYIYAQKCRPTWPVVLSRPDHAILSPGP